MSDEAERRPSAPPDVVLEARAELDVPGETRRQGRVFLTWFGCLALAVVLSSIAGAHIPLSEEHTSWADEELAAARARRVKIALAFGLLLPALLTAAIRSRYRRGGAHARGIVVDITAEGELRVWGRGYGERVRLDGARVSERLVDVYAGRLGAWRQRRLRIQVGARRPSGPAAEGLQRGDEPAHNPSPSPLGGVRDIQLATPASEGDTDLGLRVEGGEGDCIELDREDYERIRREVLSRAQ